MICHSLLGNRATRIPSTIGQMKNLLLVDPVKMVSMTILRNENLKKYLGET